MITISRADLSAAFASMGFANLRFVENMTKLVIDDEREATEEEWEAARFIAGKLASHRAVNAKRDTMIMAGFTYDFGATAGTRTLDQRNEADAVNWLGLSAMADKMIAAGSGSAMLSLRDASNSTLEASANTIAAAMVAMAQWRSAIMAHSWTIKDQIEAAADQEALDEIVVETGWPSA